MRLIVGYDGRSKELIYSDPWGPGEAYKRMAIADGNAITLGMYFVEPKY